MPDGNDIVSPKVGRQIVSDIKRAVLEIQEKYGVTLDACTVKWYRGKVQRINADISGDKKST